MKKLILSLFMIGSLWAHAHVIVPKCNNNGRFSFAISSVNTGLTCTIKAGGWDTTFKCPSTSFTVSIPQTNTTVHFSFSDGYKQDIKTNNSLCAGLPLKFRDFKAKYLDNNTIQVDFILFEVTNIRQINILVGTDGTHYKPVMVVLPDNIQTETNYSLKIKLR